jgi:adenylate cyclase
MAGLFRIRRFRTRLLLLILGLLTAALGTSYVLVTRANHANAVAHIEDSLAGAVRVFWFSVELRKERLAQSAKVVSADWPMRTLYLQETLDRHTLRSTLASYAERLEVPVVTAFTPEGEMLATTMDELTDEQCGPFRHLVQKAEDENMEQASDFAYLGGRLHVLVVVPLYAPRPNVIGWFGAAFPIDDTFAQGLKRTTQAEVTFVSGLSEANRRVLASTLPAEWAGMVAAKMAPVQNKQTRTSIVTLAHEPYVTLFEPLGLLGDDPARIALQRSLKAELEPARDLENVILLISAAALFVASLVALGAARGVSQPVQALARHTELIARGDYQTQLELNRPDELGQLAESLQPHEPRPRRARPRARPPRQERLPRSRRRNSCATAPRSAAKSARSPSSSPTCAASPPSARSLPPRELIALLNRYLDRMSAAIEAHGGVIDKFIGDAIMALFGAPSQSRCRRPRPRRRPRPAKKPSPTSTPSSPPKASRRLAFGIGINTARVVAGNIGSHRRLNYSVIGDGVNVASRLQSLTRTRDRPGRVEGPRRRSPPLNIILSAATLPQSPNHLRLDRQRRFRLLLQQLLLRGQLAGRHAPTEFETNTGTDLIVFGQARNTEVRYSEIRAHQIQFSNFTRPYRLEAFYGATIYLGAGGLIYNPGSAVHSVIDDAFMLTAGQTWNIAAGSVRVQGGIGRPIPPPS